jgi:hypothetical protein
MHSVHTVSCRCGKHDTYLVENLRTTEDATNPLADPHAGIRVICPAPLHLNSDAQEETALAGRAHTITGAAMGRSHPVRFGRSEGIRGRSPDDPVVGEIAGPERSAPQQARAVAERSEAVKHKSLQVEELSPSATPCSVWCGAATLYPPRCEGEVPMLARPMKSSLRARSGVGSLATPTTADCSRNASPPSLRRRRLVIASICYVG